jgi:hypothetical protein
MFGEHRVDVGVEPLARRLHEHAAIDVAVIDPIIGEDATRRIVRGGRGDGGEQRALAGIEGGYGVQV